MEFNSRVKKRFLKKIYMFSGKKLLKEEAEKRIQPEDLAKVVLDVLTIPETALISQVIVRPPKKYR